MRAYFGDGVLRKEGHTAQHSAERDLGDELAYWAPAESAGVEVDFLLRRGQEHCGLEVKSARRFHSRHLTGLRAIASLAKLRRRILLYRGDRRLQTEDGIEVWPVPTFLEALETGTLWP
jgi:predicted AAA+ superfamily ATPase